MITSNCYKTMLHINEAFRLTITVPFIMIYPINFFTYHGSCIMISQASDDIVTEHHHALHQNTLFKL